ncbi:MAG: type II secretion system F family protein, partial [Gammaproteobacteria bacterium]|nr:type II secretion system F family protein [Gammaproteobacteria bacterium]
MPEFDYEYADRQGNLHRGSMAAESAVEAVRRLNVNGQTVVDVSERAAPSAGFLRRRLSAQEVVVALHELATLLEAGVSLSDAVLAQGRGSHHPALAEAFANMATRLGRGENFLSALRSC